MMRSPRGNVRTLVLFIAVIYGAQMYAQENYRVREIRFTGNENLSSSTLREQLYMHSTSWLEELFGSDSFLFSKQILQDDLKNLVRYYQRKGFLNARLEDPVVIADHDGQTVTVHIPVHEGVPVTVDTVTVLFPDLDSTSQAMRDSIWDIAIDDIVLKKGVRFRDDDLLQDRGTIVSTFSNAGFPFASAQHMLVVDTVHHTAAVIWTIATGPPVSFGDVSYAGNERIPTSIVKNKLAFTPGSTFNESKLKETERDVYSLLLYRTVTVQPLYQDTQDGKVPVKITVQEAQQFKTWFSVGYGQEEKFRASVRFTWKGLFKSTPSLQLAVHRSALDPYSLSGWYVDPDFVIPRTTFIAYPFVRRETEPSYTANRSGIRFSLQRPIIEEVYGALSYALEHVSLDTSSISRVNTLGPLLEKYWKSSLMVTLSRITAKPIFEPRSGSHATVALTLNGRIFGTPYQFTRVLADYREYHEVWKIIVLAWRLRMGAATTGEEHDFIPVEERFYSGGSTSVRGWKRFELGPIDDSGKPIGGNSLLEASLELRFPIWSVVSGVGFLDFGNVWIPSFTYKLNELRYSAGAGIRIRTPIGPIRLDAAVPIFDEVTNWEFIFSFGQAF